MSLQAIDGSRWEFDYFLQILHISKKFTEHSNKENTPKSEHY